MITAWVPLMRFDHAPVTWHHFCSITGSVPTTIHYAVRIGSQNPNLEAKRSAMTLTERRKCFEVAAFLMLAPSIWTQSYLISGYPPGSPKPPLPPWQPRSTAWRPLGSTRTSSNSSATPSFRKQLPKNARVVTCSRCSQRGALEQRPIHLQEIKLFFFYYFFLHGTQCNVRDRHIRRTNGLLKRLWTLFLLQSLALGGSGLITELASTGRK